MMDLWQFQIGKKKKNQFWPNLSKQKKSTLMMNFWQFQKGKTSLLAKSYNLQENSNMLK